MEVFKRLEKVTEEVEQASDEDSEDGVILMAGAELK